MFRRFSKRKRLNVARAHWQELGLHHIATPDALGELVAFWETIDIKDLLPITALHRACTDIDARFESIDELMRVFKQFTTSPSIDMLFRYMRDFPEKSHRCTLDDYWGKHAFEGAAGYEFIDLFKQCLQAQAEYNRQSSFISINRLCEALVHDAIAFTQALIQPEVSQ